MVVEVWGGEGGFVEVGSRSEVWVNGGGGGGGDGVLVLRGCLRDIWG